MAFLKGPFGQEGGLDVGPGGPQNPSSQSISLELLQPLSPQLEGAGAIVRRLGHTWKLTGPIIRLIRSSVCWQGMIFPLCSFNPLPTGPWQETSRKHGPHSPDSSSESPGVLDQERLTREIYGRMSNGECGECRMAILLSTTLPIPRPVHPVFRTTMQFFAGKNFYCRLRKIIEALKHRYR